MQLQLSTLLSIAALLASTSEAKPYHNYGKQFEQEALDKFNFLKYTGGFGPYVDGAGYGISRDTPDSCTVDQVFLASRHGERYPDKWDGTEHLEALEKLDKYISKNKTLTGSLSFYNTWDNFLKEKNWWSQESFSGPYAGLADAYAKGMDFRSRYGHLWDGEGVPIFSSGYERVIDTARAFGQGFFSFNYSDSAYLNIISENKSMGANSLTATCGGKLAKESLCDNVTGILPEMYIAAERLNKENPGLNLTASDIYNIMGVAPYELNVKAYTPWYDVFTDSEWVAYGYGAGDLYYYYCAGPGLPAAKPVGSLYANATNVLMNEGPEKAGSLFFSFTHDTDVTQILVAMGLFIPDKPLDMNKVGFLNNNYKAGDLSPMGMNLVLERLSCNKTAISDEGTYVRVILNNAVIPIDNCTDGPGYTCSLQNYTQYLNTTMEKFSDVCEVPDGAPTYLDFFWNYNKTTDSNYLKGDIVAGTTLTM